MKVLCNLCVIITAVSAFHWAHKRNDYGQGEGGPDCTDANECWRLYKPINRVLREPSFNVLIGSDGRLDLDCSNSTLIEAGDCEDDVSECARFFSKTALHLAWDLFCQNKEGQYWNVEVEGLQACWNSPELEMAGAPCMHLRNRSECIERSMTSLAECGETGGRLMRELVETLFGEQI